MKMTPLMIAIRGRDFESAREIVEKEGYDPDVRDITGFNTEDWLWWVRAEELKVDIFGRI